PGGGTPGGNVEFFDGATSLGVVALNASRQATLTLSTPAIGSHSITAVYAGDSNFTASTSPALNQVVNAASTTTTLTSSANPSLTGQSVTFTATVAAVAPGSGIASGSITFKDGSTVLGTATLNASGQATFSTSALSVATHSISAVYGGDGNFAASTSPTLTQTVNVDSTSTT